MQRRSKARRLRRGMAMAIPTVAAVLVLGPVAAANAATTAPVVYTPTDTPSLQTDISAADGQPAGTLSIIQLCGCQYQPTTSLPLSGNIEITGPPTYQANSSTSQVPQINGDIVDTITSPSTVPLFAVSPGANILFKGFELASGGTGQGVGAIQDGSATVELDNMDVTGSTGSVIVLSGTGSANVTNSTITNSSSDGIEQNGSGSVALVSDTFSYNALGAFEGPNVASYNTLFYKNKQNGGTGACNTAIGTAGDTFVGDYADDTSCGTNGVTDPGTNAWGEGRAQVAVVKLAAFNGGPGLTSALASNAPNIGMGIAQYCPTADQRFFLYTKGSNGSCDVGAYQTTGLQDGSTTGPSCTIQGKNYTSGTAATMTVYAAEPSGIGIGADGINTTITNNGSVMYGTNGSTWFNAPISPPVSADTSYPSNGNYNVTAQKPPGDFSMGGTKWSFYMTDWLGNTSYCN